MVDCCEHGSEKSMAQLRHSDSTARNVSGAAVLQSSASVRAPARSLARVECRSMASGSSAAKGTLTFVELLGVLTQDGVVSAAVAQNLFGEEDRQLARLARERRAQLPSGPAGRGAESPGPIGAIELFLSFGVKDERGRPITEDRVTELYARRLGRSYIKLDPLQLDAEFSTRVFSRAFARKHNLLAISDLGHAVLVATTDPIDVWTLESVERSAGKSVEVVIASRGDVQRLITELYGFRRSVASAQDGLTRAVDIGNLEQLVRMKTEREIESSDEHVIHAVEYLFSSAFSQRASDIHIEPKRDKSVVRYRIDGALHEVNRLPKVVHLAVINRIKTLARLDIAEKRRPQDGRIKTEFDSKTVEMRVSTLPVAFGEKVVLRIFDPDIVDGDLERLGFFERERAIFERLILRPHGIVLVTGPTGSGKTTTLYTALRRLATDDVNVTTIEDPIEMVDERINQTAINPAIGLGFSESLRTLLRQDPDIIMVGEIRDLETARHAIQAALTGHLVFSTLHTNDAAGTITRLFDLGCEHFLLASTLSGVIAQRLVRRVCVSCEEDRVLSAGELSRLGHAALLARPDGPPLVKRGKGCVDCRQSGYWGRSAIYEMFELTDAVRQLVMTRADAGAIKRVARREGMTTLREAALRKMWLGETTFEEVLAVTQEDEA
ncbi:MAG: type II/IV secretion system protein [Myxococcales bacterium]|nr:type II/IV secretion system protein [Myxococcales bacterium]